jgi:hypothetical protein
MQKSVAQELVDEYLKGYQGSYSDSFKLSIKWMPFIDGSLFDKGVFDILVMFFIGAALMKSVFWQQGFTTRNIWFMVLV